MIFWVYWLNRTPHNNRPTYLKKEKNKTKTSSVFYWTKWMLLLFPKRTCWVWNLLFTYFHPWICFGKRYNYRSDITVMMWTGIIGTHYCSYESDLNMKEWRKAKQPERRKERWGVVYCKSTKCIREKKARKKWSIGARLL